MDLQNQLVFAEQGLAADQARLQQLQAEKTLAEAAGQDTTSINKTIADLNADIAAGTQDVLDAQQNINTQAQADIAATETAGPVPTEPDTSTQTEQENEEELSDSDSDTLDSNSETSDEEPEEDPFERSRVDAENNFANGDDSATADIEKVVLDEKAVSAQQVPNPKPIPNPLHEYSTYTYGITLFILSKEDYETLQRADVGELDAWTPTKALISSGGTYQGTKRDTHFKEDFYFDNLRVNTVIGMNSMTRGTNAIEMTFSVIEPYGLTLLDRLIDAAIGVGSKNYLDQPYLLQIDFFGSKDLGDIHAPIPKLTKRFPIKIIEMKIKAGVKGSEYALRAVPYNHSAFSETINTTPINFEIAAGTVEEFFKAQLTNDFNRQYEDRKAAKERSEQAARVQNDPAIAGEMTTEELAAMRKQKDESDALLKTAYQVDSYPGAINAWFKKLVETNNTKVENSVEFYFDKPMWESKIVVPNKNDYNRYEMTSTKKLSAAVQGNNQNVSGATPSAGLNKNRMNFSINAGTSIVDVINMIMRNTEYLKSQVVDPLSEAVTFKENTVVKFYKIIPQIILKDFDVNTNAYGKLVRYHVKEYSYFNTKHPNLPYAKPNSAIKEYNYMYTGKNIDILDFAIDFDTAFYTTINVDRKNTESTNSSLAAETEKDKTVAKRPYGGNEKSIAMNKHNYVSNDLSTAAAGANDTESNLNANVVKSIYSSSRGDMINVKIKILGDPHFIKQDDLYTNPGQKNYDGKSVMVNDGTVAMDNSEIFCRLNFKTPVDMDEETGLPRVDGRYVESKFSGLYKILTVDNEFSRGQFIQTLDCIRIFDDNKTTSSVERAESNQAGTSPAAAEGLGDPTTTTTPDEDPFEQSRREAEENFNNSEGPTEQDVDGINPDEGENEEQAEETETIELSSDLAGEPEIDLSEFA